MSPRASHILTYVIEHWRWLGYGPTIGEAHGVIGSRSKNIEDSALGWLLRNGYLEKPRGHRTLRPTGRCPCCGREPT